MSYLRTFTEFKNQKNIYESFREKLFIVPGLQVMAEAQKYEVNFLHSKGNHFVVPLRVLESLQKIDDPGLGKKLKNIYQRCLDVRVQRILEKKIETIINLENTPLFSEVANNGGFFGGLNEDLKRLGMNDEDIATLREGFAEMLENNQVTNLPKSSLNIFEGFLNVVLEMMSASAYCAIQALKEDDLIESIHEVVNGEEAMFYELPLNWVDIHSLCDIITGRIQAGGVRLAHHIDADTQRPVSPTTLRMSWSIEGTGYCLEAIVNPVALQHTDENISGRNKTLEFCIPGTEHTGLHNEKEIIKAIKSL